jgi:hypothetical protein
MAGDSARDKQLPTVQRGIDEQIASSKAFDPTIKNRFNDYRMPYDFNTMDKNIDANYNGVVAGINSDARADIASTKSGTLRSLASRGITGGSVVDDTISKNTNPIITNKAKSIRDLGNAKIDKKTALMDLFNKYGIDITKMATDVDLENVMSGFRKQSGLNALTGMNVNNLGNYSDATWLDDALGIANTGANVVKAFKRG